MSKQFNARVQLKNDTAENWAKASNFIPLKGEAIVYSDLNKLKIGDGFTTVEQLPFIKNTETNEYQLKSEAFSGSYNDLTNRPTLFSGDYNDLTNLPDLFSGDYEDLDNTPQTVSIATSISAASQNNAAVSPKAVYDYVQMAIASLPTVYTGDTAPNSTFGNAGDIYLVTEG